MAAAAWSESAGWGSITWFRDNLRPPASIYNHALAVGFSRGFVVTAAIAPLALRIGIATIRVSPPRSIRRPFSARIAPRDKLPFPVHSKGILTRDRVVLSFVPGFHSVQPCELL
jgi:hypothetical protein